MIKFFIKKLLDLGLDPKRFIKEEYLSMTKIKTSIEQGHHCTGKCTKLDKDHVFPLMAHSCNSKCNCNNEKHWDNKIETEYKEWKEKECEHEWMVPVNKTIKQEVGVFCIKCNIKQGQSPFWLKVGDVIRNNTDGIGKIESILNDRISISWKYNNGWTEAQVCPSNIITSDKFKKIKLVSPALYQDENFNWKPTEVLFLERPKRIVTQHIIIEKFIWPASDQFGREIWLEVDE